MTAAAAAATHSNKMCRLVVVAAAATAATAATFQHADIRGAGEAGACLLLSGQGRSPTTAQPGCKLAPCPNSKHASALAPVWQVAGQHILHSCRLNHHQPHKPTAAAVAGWCCSVDAVPNGLQDPYAVSIRPAQGAGGKVRGRLSSIEPRHPIVSHYPGTELGVTGRMAPPGTIG